MVVRVIDFEGVNDFWEFYRVIIGALDFPHWCGRNADAIWDMLTGYIDIPEVICFRNFNSLPKSLNETKAMIREVFVKASDYYKDLNAKVTDENLCFRFEIID